MPWLSRVLLRLHGRPTVQRINRNLSRARHRGPLRRRCRAQATGRGPAGRDRRPGDQLHPHRHVRGRHPGRGAGRPLRALRPAGRGAGVGPRGHRPRRADHGAGRRPAGGGVLGPGPRHGTRERPRRDRQGRPLRALCPGGGGRRRGRQAEDGLPAGVDGSGHGDHRRRPEGADPASHGRRRSGHRRDHRGAQRSVRPLPAQGDRLALAGVRGATVLHHVGAGPGSVRPGQDPSGSAFPGSPARVRPGPGHLRRHPVEGRPLRALRDRRRDQRVVAQGGRGRHPHPRTGGRAPRRPSGCGAGQEAGDPQGGAQEGGRQRRPRAPGRLRPPRRRDQRKPAPRRWA